MRANPNPNQWVVEHDEDSGEDEPIYFYPTAIHPVLSSAEFVEDPDKPDQALVNAQVMSVANKLYDAGVLILEGAWMQEKRYYFPNTGELRVVSYECIFCYEQSMNSDSKKFPHRDDDEWTCPIELLERATKKAEERPWEVLP